MPLVPLVTVTEYQTGDGMHRRLRGYKDAPVAEVRDECTEQLAQMLGGWQNVDAAGTGRGIVSRWDLVATVPSSRRPEGAPVAAVVDAVPRLGRCHRPLLARGPAPTGHLLAARRGFVIRPEVDRDRLRGARVLLVDDTVVTGARAQSAAAALRLGGAQVVGVLALGRAVSTRTEGPSSP
jgi:glutamine phosphoribosylpyrophosphate amidotransferase